MVDGAHPPWVVVVLQYFEKILDLVDSMRCALQDQVNIIGCSAVGADDIVQNFGQFYLRF